MPTVNARRLVEEACDRQQRVQTTHLNPNSNPTEETTAMEWAIFYSVAVICYTIYKIVELRSKN